MDSISQDLDVLFCKDAFLMHIAFANEEAGFVLSVFNGFE